MAITPHTPRDFTRPLRRILVGGLIALFVALFVFWRLDGPRAERLRAEVIDRVVPEMSWALLPVRKASDMIAGFQSYSRLYEQNQALRRELLQMESWKEAALQLERENAKLRDLNRLRLDPRLTYITGVVLADSGTSFRQSVLVNVGRGDGVASGWAATDGLGLVGRVAGVAGGSARVLLLTDPSSRVPVTLQPSGQRAVLTGDNTTLPLLDFVEAPEEVRPGDRVVSSGDGAVFPAGIPVGRVVTGRQGRERVRPAADISKLEFLRLIRSPATESIEGPGGLVAPGDAGSPEPAQ